MEVGNHKAKQELISPNWIHNDPYIGVSLFEKFLFQNVFRPHENAKPAFWTNLFFEERLEKDLFEVDS